LKSREQIMAEARAFVREGARELVVTGVSMGDWGSDLEVRGEGRNSELCSLLRAVSTIEGLERVRVSSLDPADVDDEWLYAVAGTEKVCPQIHLALQSGSAGVLRRMRRRYTPEMFLKWAKRWREIRPDGGLTTDVIVGFPGETEDEWRETMELCREARFSAIHVFPYSPREDTFAALHLQELGGLVLPQVQTRRVDELIALGNQLSAEFAAQFIGQEQEILVEGRGGSVVEGLTPHYVKAIVEIEAPAQVGDIVRFVAKEWRDGAIQSQK
jgi:threonylcarbamoyladenosine tRNA methylthiotransferase MtaB